MNEWAGKSGSSQATLASAAKRASVAELTFIHSAPGPGRSLFRSDGTSTQRRMARSKSVWGMTVASEPRGGDSLSHLEHYQQLLTKH